MLCSEVCRRRCYQMAMAGMVLHTGNAKREGCVSEHKLSVVCCTPVIGQEPFPRTAASVASVQGRRGGAITLGTLPVHPGQAGVGAA